MTGTYCTGSEQETVEIARRLGTLLKAGDTIAFRGGLGAGKTAFVRGVAQGMGIDAFVSSPTFTLIQSYESPGKPILHHFDMYRITDPDSLESTGYYDYLDGDGVLAIEWSEQIDFALPGDALVVDIAVTGENTRTITISGGKQPCGF